VKNSLKYYCSVNLIVFGVHLLRFNPNGQCFFNVNMQRIATIRHGYTKIKFISGLNMWVREYFNRLFCAAKVNGFKG